jgi:very-short-patch-repair endonuclease
VHDRLWAKAEATRWFERHRQSIVRHDLYAVAARGTKAESATEARLISVLRSLGLAVALQVPVPACRRGGWYHLDCACREEDASLLLAIEVDGPHHTVAAQAALDRQRDRHLVRRGWYVVRVPHLWLDSTTGCHTVAGAIQALACRHREAALCAQGRLRLYTMPA